MKEQNINNENKKPKMLKDYLTKETYDFLMDLDPSEETKERYDDLFSLKNKGE